ncbi:MAG: hypothetical protein ACREJM_10500 [Candidatus Saccharimonadales bacterium]
MLSVAANSKAQLLGAFGKLHAYEAPQHVAPGDESVAAGGGAVFAGLVKATDERFE